VDTDLSLASAHQAGDDLGCVKTSANISRTDEMGHVRAVLMDMDSLNCRLAHVPEQKILAHRVFTQPRSGAVVQANPSADGPTPDTEGFTLPAG